MDFIEVFFNYIDRLSTVDIFCISAIYTMILVLMLNIWFNFKMLDVAKSFHKYIFISIAIIGINLYFLNEQILDMLCNNLYVKTAYLVNILFILFYNIHDSRNNQIEKINCAYKNDSSFLKNCVNTASNSNGIYENYNYYYSNKDKYSEPYTSRPRVINNEEKNKTDEFLLEENDFNVNNIIQTDENYYNDWPVCNTLYNEIMNNNSGRNYCFNNQEDDYYNNSFERRLDIVSSNMEILRDGIQGITDRMTKIFELMAVVIKKS